MPARTERGGGCFTTAARNRHRNSKTPHRQPCGRAGLVRARRVIGSISRRLEPDGVSPTLPTSPCVNVSQPMWCVTPAHPARRRAIRLDEPLRVRHAQAQAIRRTRCSQSPRWARRRSSLATRRSGARPSARPPRPGKRGLSRRYRHRSDPRASNTQRTRPEASRGASFSYRATSSRHATSRPGLLSQTDSTLWMRAVSAPFMIAARPNWTCSTFATHLLRKSVRHRGVPSCLSPVPVRVTRPCGGRGVPGAAPTVSPAREPRVRTVQRRQVAVRRHAVTPELDALPERVLDRPGGTPIWMRESAMLSGQFPFWP